MLADVLAAGCPAGEAAAEPASAATDARSAGGKYRCQSTLWWPPLSTLSSGRNSEPALVWTCSALGRSTPLPSSYTQRVVTA